MKRLAVILSLLIVAPCAYSAETTQTTTQPATQATDYYTPYFNQGNIVQGKQVQHAPQNSKVYKQSSGNTYILKYNVDDLESAPWLNGGKRKYD